ncbi:MULTISPECIES: hypothetical protein [Trichocoleus]|uniref:Uncharacterized protein n=1 Tax=Trichocoleus desertorum GB2-A4 TaxID=2933944 RepID=A0ABV0JB42_9CYAN|nr:hypothetical protein [Trichocoleus sp. FACHB-46]MBD1863246.1 hypothetical protein [Trichocoleus sp. FACHB-46]
MKRLQPQTNFRRCRAIAGLPHLALGFCCLLGSFSAIAPATLAETQQLSFTLNTVGNQSFDDLMQQAESLARNTIEQTFANNPETTAVAVSVLGERNGQEVPLLLTNVSRVSWQQQPRLQPWTKYFSRPSITLLGFLEPQTTQPATATASFVSQTARSRLEDTPGFRDD